MQVQGHAVLPAPTPHQIEVEFREKGGDRIQALKRLLDMRQRVIDAETADPLRHGWEPSIWWIADAIIGHERASAPCERAIMARFAMDWATWSAAVRNALGFATAVTMLLILGANRSSKSEHSAKRAMMVLTGSERKAAYACHQTDKRSKRDQQPLYWRHFPPEWRVSVKSALTYVGYKEKTGFSEGSFILPNGSSCAFINYSQDVDDALEGIEPDLVNPDELVPVDWIESFSYRLATRSGKGIFTFTPVHGYTPSVKIFCDGATVVKESIAYMLPRDGGNPDEPRAIGLTDDEYREVWDAEKEVRPARAPESRPEDCLAWFRRDGDKLLLNEGNPGQPAPAAGRLFDTMPRVMRCMDPQKAVIFFHCCDNPYGRPRQVMVKAKLKGTEEIKIRVYGKAEKTVSAVIPKFNRKVHVIPAKAIPTQGTNHHFVDPAGDRNFFMAWFRTTSEGIYLYREWPSGYWIPTVGVPGPWALPSGKKDGLNDGKRGEGQRSWGFGLLRYKFEIARLEGWPDYTQWVQGSGFGGQGLEVDEDFKDAYPEDELLEEWLDPMDAPPSMGRPGELIEERYIDSRAASAPRIENDRPVTLQTDFLDIGMDFNLTPGAGITDGLEKINAYLDYDKDAAGSFFNHPKFHISDACVNSIYAMENYMNADGENGACKDPIDLIRYRLMLGLANTDEAPAERSRGGTSYGMRAPSGTHGVVLGMPGRRLPTGGVSRL